MAIDMAMYIVEGLFVVGLILTCIAIKIIVWYEHSMIRIVSPIMAIINLAAFDSAAGFTQISGRLPVQLHSALYNC